MAMLTKFKVALVQLKVGLDKSVNVARAIGKIKEAADSKADLIVLPECFNSPYGNQYFKQYSEEIPGQTTNAIAEAAKLHGVHIIAGSIPEQDGDKFYNSCVIFNRAGKFVAKHRKLHLFDIDIPGKQRFKESETLSPGQTPTIVQTEFCKIGVGICYDIRFGELTTLYNRAGCQLLVYPAAFNMTTGPAHWELLGRSTALSSQTFVALCAPARDTSATYVSYGNSMLINPWGTILCQAGDEEKTIYADIDLEFLQEVRDSIPIGKQRRTDIYETIAQSPLLPHS